MRFLTQVQCPSSVCPPTELPLRAWAGPCGPRGHSQLPDCSAPTLHPDPTPPLPDRPQASPCSCFPPAWTFTSTSPPSKSCPSFSITSPEMLHPQRMGVTFSCSLQQERLHVALIGLLLLTYLVWLKFYLCQYLSHSPHYMASCSRPRSVSSHI